MDKALKLKDFAAAIEETESRVRHMIKKGLPIVRIDRTIRIRVSDYQKWLDSCVVTVSTYEKAPQTKSRLAGKVESFKKYAI